ncbi:hypothetical protein [Nocardia sp. R7R-8]|uniref:hypothetical protein n=1 Tax=Nocardia sp. R7R-8 TaxID=3459304 RepID=UPI00403DCD1D
MGKEMAEIDIAALMQQAITAKAPEEYDSIRSQIDAALSDDEATVQAARDAITAVSGTTDERLLAEQTFGRVWTNIHGQLTSAVNAIAAIGIGVQAIQAADTGVRPLMAQEVVTYLQGAYALTEDTITQRVLIPLSPDLASALEQQDANQKRATIARHNVDQAQQGTGHYVPEGSY